MTVSTKVFVCCENREKIPVCLVTSQYFLKTWSRRHVVRSSRRSNRTAGNFLPLSISQYPMIYAAVSFFVSKCLSFLFFGAGVPNDMRPPHASQNESPAKRGFVWIGRSKSVCRSKADFAPTYGMTKKCIQKIRPATHSFAPVHSRRIKFDRQASEKHGCDFERW